MDVFSKYLKKRRSELFFFIKNNTIAVLRFSDRTEIVDMTSGEVLKTLKIKYISEAIYCNKHHKLYLKSVDNGYIYVYNFTKDLLCKLFNLAQTDNGIFLSHDEKKIIAYNSGYIYEIDTKTDNFRILYEAQIKCYYKKGWDNPNKKCYEFIYSSNTIPCTILRLSYKGNLLSEEIVKIDNIPFFIIDIIYSNKDDIYVIQGRKHYIMANIVPPTKNDNLCIISKSNINNYVYISKENYIGGCLYSLIYKNYLLYCCGNTKIKVIDIGTFKLIKSIEIDKTMVRMQYDSHRNILYISTGNGCKILDKFF